MINEKFSIFAVILTYKMTSSKWITSVSIWTSANGIMIYNNALC